METGIGYKIMGLLYYIETHDLFFQHITKCAGRSVEEWLKANVVAHDIGQDGGSDGCLLYSSPSPRDATLSRMPSSA